VTARAQRAGSPLRGTIARQAAAFLAGASLAISTSADAQVGAVASVYSDYRFRGVSFSDGRPVGIVDLSYDLRNGLYAAVSGRAVATRDEGPQMLGFGLNAGYAARLRPELTVDFGVVHSRYSHYSGLGAGRSYTEFYTGVAGKLIGGRISVSPDYLGSAHWTAYGEVDAHLDLSTRTAVDGEIGVLTPLGGSYRGTSRPQVDARLGLARRLGRLTLHAAVTARSRAYLYQGRARGRTALIVGISTAL
jgi:uncharacterized protein (TIGR02001 family)